MVFYYFLLVYFDYWILIVVGNINIVLLFSSISRCIFSSSSNPSFSFSGTLFSTELCKYYRHLSNDLLLCAVRKSSADTFADFYSTCILKFKSYLVIWFIIHNWFLIANRLVSVLFENRRPRIGNCSDNGMNLVMLIENPN
jgi:hypothetical protein